MTQKVEYLDPLQEPDLSRCNSFLEVQERIIKIAMLMYVKENMR